MSRDITALPLVPADRRVFYGADPSQFFDLWEPQGSRGTAVMIHGGFWRARYDLSHASHLCAALARSGLAVASLEYRRVGNGGGWPATFDDIKSGVAAAAAHLDAAPVVVGYSAGGHLALRLAAEPVNLRGVLALAPVADLRLCYDLHLSNDAVVEFLGASPAGQPEVYADACPSRRPASVTRLLLHGTADVVVPIALSRAYTAARADDPGKVALIELPGAGHFDLIDPGSAAWPKVLDCVFRLLE